MNNKYITVVLFAILSCTSITAQDEDQDALFLKDIHDYAQ